MNSKVKYTKKRSIFIRKHPMFGIGQSRWKSTPVEDDFNLSIIFKICNNFILVFDKNANEIIYFSLVVKITYDSLSKSKHSGFFTVENFSREHLEFAGLEALFLTTRPSLFVSLMMQSIIIHRHDNTVLLKFLGAQKQGQW